MNEAFEKILEGLENIHRVVKTDEDAEWNRAIYKSTEIVQEIAEEYNGGWIACSERLPEENGHYLIFDNRGMIYESTYLANMWLIAASVIDVIAWQPLPEPYKEREHETTNVF